MISPRRLGLWLGRGAGVVAIAFPLLREAGPDAWPPRALELSRFLALELGLALSAYWMMEAARARSFAAALPPLAAVAVAAVLSAWIIRFFGDDAAVFMDPTPDLIAAAAISLALTLATAWRVVGRSITLTTAAVICLGWLAQFAPAVTGVSESPAGSHLIYLAFGSAGLFGVPLDIIANMVLAFVVFGAAFEVVGGSDVISSVALRLSRRNRAGAIKACVLASGFFGTISGAVTSNVMTSGSFSIPSMRRIGVPNATAAGIEAAASTGGQIMPPVLGAAAFLLADLVGVPYGTVVIASIGPALAIYLAFFRQADRVVLGASPRMEAETEPLRWIWLVYLAPPAAIVATLLHSHALVGTAAIVGICACLPILLTPDARLSAWRRFRSVAPGLIATTINLVVVASTIGLLLGAINASGLATAGAIWIGGVGAENLALALIVTALSAFILGMGVATAGVYIIAGSLLAPGLVEAGVPTLAAHFFVLYCGILSMITPPVAFASIAASALAGAPLLATARAAMSFGWILYVMPFLIVVQPGLLLLGTWTEIAAAWASVAAFVLLSTSVVIRPAFAFAGATGVIAAMIRSPDSELLLALSAALIFTETILARLLRSRRKQRGASPSM